MKNYCFGLCLILAPLSAETMSPITYHLSEKGAWCLVDHFESCRGRSDIYTPNGMPREGATEYFGVHQTIHTCPIDSFLYFEQSLQAMYPKSVLELHRLEEDEISALIEWSVTQEALEIRGLSRLFSLDNSTVILAYFNCDKGGQEEARNVWIPLLMRAELSEGYLCPLS